MQCLMQHQLRYRGVEQMQMEISQKMCARINIISCVRICIIIVSLLSNHSGEALV